MDAPKCRQHFLQLSSWAAAAAACFKCWTTPPAWHVQPKDAKRKWNADWIWRRQRCWRCQRQGSKISATHAHTRRHTMGECYKKKERRWKKSSWSEQKKYKQIMRKIRIQTPTCWAGRWQLDEARRASDAKPILSSTQLSSTASLCCINIDAQCVCVCVSVCSYALQDMLYMYICWCS